MALARAAALLALAGRTRALAPSTARVQRARGVEAVEAPRAAEPGERVTLTATSSARRRPPSSPTERFWGACVLAGIGFGLGAAAAKARVLRAERKPRVAAARGAVATLSQVVGEQKPQVVVAVGRGAGPISTFRRLAVHMLAMVLDTIVRYHPKRGRYISFPPLSVATWIAHAPLVIAGNIAVLKMLLQGPFTTPFALGVVLLPAAIGGFIDMASHCNIGSDTVREVGLFKTGQVLLTTSSLSVMFAVPFGLKGALGFFIVLPLVCMGVLTFGNAGGKLAGMLSLTSVWCSATLSPSVKAGYTVLSLSGLISNLLQIKFGGYTDATHQYTAYLISFGFILMAIGV